MKELKNRKWGSLSKVTWHTGMGSRSWAHIFNPEGLWLSPLLESSFQSYSAIGILLDARCNGSYKLLIYQDLDSPRSQASRMSVREFLDWVK